ncbi:MAG: translation initiation factor IF-2, partial [Balneolaceae bacterium]
MTDKRQKKLFKVASEFNVATKTIVDTLAESGFDIANKPNSSITPEMYRALQLAYGEDDADGTENDLAAEDVKSSVDKSRPEKSDRVSFDSFLEPIDDLPLEPQDDIEPKEDIEEPETGEIEKTADKGKKLDTEPVQEQKAADKKELKVKQEQAKKPDKAEKQPVKEEVAKTEEEPSQPADKSLSDESDEIITDKSKEKKEEVESEDPVKAASEVIKEPEEIKEEAYDTDEEDDEDILRGRAGKLKGTKILGKVEFAKASDPKKKKKKRKRRKDRDQEVEKAVPKKKELKKKEDTESQTAKEKTGKKAKKSRSRKVDEEDVERKMRETIQKMKESGTVGTRRQKRRRQRKEEREEERLLQEEMHEGDQDVIEVTEFITVSDLADLLDVSPNEVITACMSIGMMVSINQRLDASTIELVASEFDTDVEFVDAEEVIEEIEVDEDDPEDLEPRAPIITVMGHVDHGKTSLLDYIRKTKVAAGEAGGITQHVGAYEVKTDDGRKITFLDTPGHEAFTAMRSRGAQATDIVILVVAADDAVMPQTIEAINHAKAAGVPIVAAINKMDKEGANPDKIKQQLADNGVIVEEWGGSNQCAEVSAHTGMGIEELLEKVLIEAELMELKANPNRRAQGIILEARVDKGKGIVANLLVQNGTLKIGDPFVAGPCFGRVRAMENEHGQRLKEAGPSTPVQLTGFDNIPQAGDKLIVPKDEKTAKEIANQRQQIKREQSLRTTKHLTLDDLSRRMALGEVSELNIIIKADVDGSIEALSGALQKLSTDEVAVNIIHTGSGAITESDVLLASASDAIIIGFQVRPSANARKLAENEKIDIRLFSVIYDAVDEVHDALEGLLSPEIREEILGYVEVREVFKVSKVGTIAGCYVLDGKINRNNRIRVIRDGVVVFDGEIDSLKRFKD